MDLLYCSFLTIATVGAGVGVVVSSERCIPGVGDGVGVAAADESRLMASPLNRRSSVCTSASPVIGRAFAVWNRRMASCVACS